MFTEFCTGLCCCERSIPKILNLHFDVNTLPIVLQYNTKNKPQTKANSTSDSLTFTSHVNCLFCHLFASTYSLLDTQQSRLPVLKTDTLHTVFPCSGSERPLWSSSCSCCNSQQGQSLPTSSQLCFVFSASILASSS